jgi:hypothetical protein
VRLTLTALREKLQPVKGTVRSDTGPLAGCRVSTSLAGQAIVTETDNTGESATAYYGDINFMSSKTGS